MIERTIETTLPLETTKCPNRKVSVDLVMSVGNDIRATKAKRWPRSLFGRRQVSVTLITRALPRSKWWPRRDQRAHFHLDGVQSFPSVSHVLIIVLCLFFISLARSDECSAASPPSVTDVLKPVEDAVERVLNHYGRDTNISGISSK